MKARSSTGVKITLEERDRQIVEAWRDSPDKNQSADDVLAFYGWLVQFQPNLISHGPGTFEHVWTLVAPHFGDPSAAKTVTP